MAEGPLEIKLQVTTAVGCIGPGPLLPSDIIRPVYVTVENAVSAIFGSEDRLSDFINALTPDQAGTLALMLERSGLKPSTQAFDRWRRDVKR